MTEREQLEQAIAALEAQRAVLGQVAVDAALAGLRRKLAELEYAEGDVEAAVKQSLPLPQTSERRIVTILFCDVKDSTTIAEKLDPEEWTGIMNHVFEYLIAPVYRHGGVVARLMGDAILAFFGAPIAHEDDPQRAVLAGLEIIESIRAFRERMKRERGLDFNVRVGVNTGLVVVGEVGSELRGEYTVMGDAVNLAARMEQTAEPGTVQIAENTHKLVAPLFEFETPGGINVKGKSEPVLVYRVIGLKAKPGRVRGLETQGISSPLVGRDAEFAAIIGCVEQLLKEQGGMVGLISEAGLGKSRLMAEVRQSLMANRISPIVGADVISDKPYAISWLEGRSLSFGQSISYWPFQEILRSYAGITEDDNEVDAWRKLENKVSALFSEDPDEAAVQLPPQPSPTVAEILPYLASLLNLEVKGNYENRVKYLDGEAMGKQIFLTSRRFFERLARAQPVVLVFEDLHWLDESSTYLLEHLLPLVESVPLLIVGLSRPGRNTPAARLQEIAARDHTDHYTEIRPAPLSPTDSAQLVRNLLEVEDLPLQVRELIVGKAEGNPFFIEEVIRTLIDTGAVARDPITGRWLATAQVKTIAIPDTIQGVIIARVDRLEEEVKHILRVASVIGRSFLYRVLKAITETGQRLDEHLTELQQLELIRKKQVTPELEYIFKHALAQQVTYESILMQKRRELHASVGQAIESLFADRLEEFYGLLAYHYARAEAWEKALEYLLKAGDQAGSMAADAEALAHYQQAMTAYARAFGDKWDPVQRAALERKMGEAFFRRGEHQQASEYFQRALSYLGFPLPTSRWGVRRAILREMAQQAGHRLLPGLFLKHEIRVTGPPVEEVWRLTLALEWIEAVINPERFVLLVFRSLNFHERHGFPLGVVLGASGLGNVFDFISFFGLAGRYLRQAVALAEQLRHPSAIGHAYHSLAMHELYLGELTKALGHARQAVEAHREVGDLRGWGVATWFVAYNFTHRGDFTNALAHSQDLVRFGQDGADDEVWCWGETVQGYALRRMGRLEEAVAHQQRAIELAEAIPDYVTRVTAGAELGLCYLHRGQLQPALAALEASRQLGIKHHVREPYALATLRNGLAEAYLVMAEQSDKSEGAGRLDKAQWACRAALKQAKGFRSKAPKAMRLQGRCEWLRGNAARAKRWWQKSLAEAEAMGLRYDLGMTHLEMGERLNERAHAERAEAIFAEIGAELDLAQARELLGRMKMN